ncbi:RHS repeat-associated core domain-containing protein [Mycoavidus cysteinexigens]|nr:RHS repeat-associated core domain-containing protein [Mycoavidus cysteinexigens]
MGAIQRWHYEDDTLPGRPLAVSEQTLEQPTPCTTERFIWAGNMQVEKDHNLAGQCVRHYDTAGLNRLDSLSLTRATLSQSRQLLADDQEAHWEGGSEDIWQAMLAEKVYLTQSTTDATGAPLTQTDAIGNQQRLAYDVAGQLMGSWLTLADDDEGEQVIVKSLTYSAAGQKLREEHGNGVVTEYTYEPQTQRLTGITTRRPSGHPSGAKILQDLCYAYDPVGNIISLRNEAEATQFWRNQKVAPASTYAYDTLYQLTRANGREMVNTGRQGSHIPTLMAPLPVDNSVYTNYTRTYTYDPGGNLSQIQHSAPATNNNYTTDITVSNRSNRAVLSQPGLMPDGVDALFDAGGHQKSLLPGQPLVWNSRGELQQIIPVNREEGASDQERYRYGGHGMRVLKIRERQTRNAIQIQRVTYLPGLELRTTHNGTTTTEDLHVLTVGEAGRAQVRVLHWEGTPPSGISNNQARYSYDNLLGSSGLELDGRGEIISQEEYYPYGGTAVWTARSQIEADYKTVRYSGKGRDETGLYYYGFRYYQPWVGRWLSADPAGTVDGLNLYQMVGNNPIARSDLMGLCGTVDWLDLPDAPDPDRVRNAILARPGVSAAYVLFSEETEAYLAKAQENTKKFNKLKPAQRNKAVNNHDLLPRNSNLKLFNALAAVYHIGTDRYQGGFVNLPGSLAQANPFSGAEEIKDGAYSIPDRKVFVGAIEKTYEEGGQEDLHKGISTLTHLHIAHTERSNQGRFSTFHGIPALHAEVEALSYSLSTDTSLADTVIFTKRLVTNSLGNAGDDFPACFNCDALLSLVHVVTGRATSDKAHATIQKAKNALIRTQRLEKQVSSLATIPDKILAARPRANWLMLRGAVQNQKRWAAKAA